VPGLDPHVFPSPEVVAGGDLAGIGLTTARAGAIRAFAAAVAGDAVRLDRSVALDRLVASIATLPGLGDWTAHYIALRMGEPDAFPATDLGLRRALQRLAPRSVVPLPELAERWRPWRALSAAHLWMAPPSASSST
jgi:AraC family transcriptional regulator, regulatory protein of adaptative response / DNA-3-methyladenine glycosylase II